MNELFGNLQIKLIDNRIASEYITKYHYTHLCNPSTLKISYGFFRNEEMVVCVVFGRPSGKNLASSIWEGGNDENTFELLRLYSFDAMPKNTESYCISRTIKQLKIDKPEVKMLVSYADKSAGHIGYIYQSSNWIYIGASSGERKIILDGERIHRRSLHHLYGTSSLKSLKTLLGDRIQISDEKYYKHKYIYIVFQTKSEKKKIEGLLKVKSLPYPKGNLSYYSTENSEFVNIDVSKEYSLLNQC